MCFIWWLDYSPFYFYNVSFPGETECSVRKNIGWDSSVFIRSCEKWMFCTRLNLVQMLVWTWMNSRTWILVCSHLWRTSLLCLCGDWRTRSTSFFFSQIVICCYFSSLWHETEVVIVMYICVKWLLKWEKNVGWDLLGSQVIDRVLERMDYCPALAPSHTSS